MIHHNYIGCDVSKGALDLYDPQTRKLSRVANEAGAIEVFVAGLDRERDFVVMEATGVHDRALRHALAAAQIPSCRRNPAHVRHFAKAQGRSAKSDPIDARTLSEFGVRFTPEPDPLPSPGRERIAALSRRRDQLVERRANDKKLLSEAFDPDVAADIQLSLDRLSDRIEAIETLLVQAVKEADAVTARTYDILLSAPGVGLVTGIALIAHCAELGCRTPKTIASLAGLAPFNDDSGARKGHRAIGGGRSRVRRALYMAALGAIRADARFRDFFERIAQRSGSKKLAIIAVARKLLTVLNAMVRDQKHFA